MSAFSTDQAFKSREDMMEWVQNTARTLGRVIVTKRSKTKPSGNSKVILICERGGVYRPGKGTSKATGTKKINCPFELIGIYTKENDGWKLSVIRDEHNHLPAQHMEGHAFVERLSPNEFQLVEDLTKKHVAPRDILGIIKEQNEDNVSTLKTIYNARNKIRKTNRKGEYNHLRHNIDHQGDGRTTADHWMEMPHTGLLLAQRFGVIVHLLSIGGNLTFFPLLIGPNQTCIPHQVVSLVHVHENHFIHVRLEGDYPMPLPNSLWSKNRSDATADWEVMYRSRITRYKELINPNQDRTVQDID